jgi:hypothetical protein
MSKCTRTAALSLVAALTAGPLAAQGFEGIVGYKMMMGGNSNSGEMIMSIKGTNMRTDVNTEGHAMTMLLDGQTQVMTMLMTEQKMYMTMDLKGARDRMQNMQHKEHTPPKFTALGTTETIAGRTCENYLVESDESKTEFCNTKGLGNYMTPRGPMGRGSSNGLTELNEEVFRAYFKDGFFPLRVTKIEDGKRKVLMEATRVEPKSLDASLFQIPSGFTEMKMPGGMMPPKHE